MNSATKMKTMELRVKEYDMVDGCSQCVHNECYQASKLKTTEATVRNFLAGGDYSEGTEDRYVEVYIGGEYHGLYTAPRIRKFSHKSGTN